MNNTQKNSLMNMKRAGDFNSTPNRKLRQAAAEIAKYLCSNAPEGAGALATRGYTVADGTLCFSRAQDDTAMDELLLCSIADSRDMDTIFRFAVAVADGMVEGVEEEMGLREPTPEALSAYSEPHALSGDQMRALIERVGRGENLSARVSDVSERTGIGQSSLWRYMELGVPARSKTVARLLGGLE
jgi:hypothetical protein